MGALVTVAMVVTGAVLVAAQGPPPGSTTEVQVGWALLATGVLGVLVVATRWERRQRSTDLTVPVARGTEWFWGPLETDEPDPLGIADPSNPARLAALRRAFGWPLPVWSPRVTAPR